MGMIVVKSGLSVLQESIAMYWPEKLEQELVVGTLVLTLKDEKPVKGYVERKIHIREEKVLA